MTRRGTHIWSGYKCGKISVKCMLSTWLAVMLLTRDVHISCYLIAIPVDSRLPTSYYQLDLPWMGLLEQAGCGAAHRKYTQGHLEQSTRRLATMSQFCQQKLHQFRLMNPHNAKTMARLI